MLRAFLLLAILCFGTDCGVAKSLPSTPEQKTTTTPRQTGEDQRGTDESPVTVKVLPTPKNHEEADTNRNERAKKQEADLWLVRLTGILALVGTLQLIVFGIQARRLRQTIETMKDTAETQLRAYITVTVAEIRGFSIGFHPQGHVAVRNSGQTPGYDVWSFSDMKFGAFPPAESFFDLKEQRDSGTRRRRRYRCAGGTSSCSQPARPTY
jgi:hypothetical protein